MPMLVAAVVFVARSRRVMLADRPPNVLLISVDTLRADHVGAYGGIVPTPAMDGLARSGVVFENVVAHAPFTLPSHASLFTGTYPTMHSVRNNGMYRLPPAADTLAEIFLRARYRTAGFVGAYVLDSRFGLDQGFELYDDELIPSSGAVAPVRSERGAAEVLGRAAAWILARQPQERWFAFVHVFDAHAPYVAPEPFRSRYLDRPYEGEVAYVDDELGRFLERLGEQGRLDGTLVVLTADHGEGLGDHREATHGMFAYETTLRVPMILSWPGALPGQRRVGARVRHVDLAPTVTELAGLPSSPAFQGESLLPLVENPERAADRDSYFESIGFAMNRGTAPLTGLYRGRYKFIHLPLPELYDLASDPEEQVNLVASRADVARELMTSLEALASQPSLGEETRERGYGRDEDLVDRLASLGYLSTPALDAPALPFGPDDDPKRLVHIAEWIDEGTIAYQRGELDSAVALFEKVIAERPETGTAYSYLARVHRRKGREEDAITVLTRARERGLETPTILFDLASVLQKSGRPRASIEAFRALTEADPFDPLAYEGLGIAHLMLGEHADAVSAFDRALALEPDNASVHADLGASYLALGRVDDAARSIEQALALDASLPTAWVNLGDLRWEQARSLEALDAWQQAARLNPRDTSLPPRIAFAMATLGRSDEAIALLEEAAQTARLNRDAAAEARARAAVDDIRRIRKRDGFIDDGSRRERALRRAAPAPES